MANKKYKEMNMQKEQERIRKEKEERFTKTCNKELTKFPIIAMVGLAVLLLLFFVDWAYIYNTDIGGKEVSISGFNCLFSGLTGNYTSSDSIYGDMAIPFNYYASAQCENLSIMTLISAVILLILLVCQLVTVITKQHMLNILCAIISVLLSIMLIVCFSMALGMKDSKILPIYCGGNPACSIKSYTIIPAIVALGLTALHGFATYKYYSLRTLLK